MHFSTQLKIINKIIISFFIIEIYFNLFFTYIDKDLLYEYEPYTDYLFLKHNDLQGVLSNSYQIKDQEIGWRNRANYKSLEINTSSDGSRVDAVRVHKNPQKTVLLIGDSYTFGLESTDKETLSSYLEEYYNNVDFINLGVSGHSHDQTYLNLKKYLKNNSKKIDHVALIYIQATAIKNQMIARGLPKPYLSVKSNKFMLPPKKDDLPLLINYSNLFSLIYGIVTKVPDQKLLITSSILIKIKKLLDNHSIAFTVIDSPQLYMNHEKKKLSAKYITFIKKENEWAHLSKLLRPHSIDLISISQRVINWVDQYQIYNAHYYEHWSPQITQKVAQEIKDKKIFNHLRIENK